jgi:hypothetical protein
LAAKSTFADGAGLGVWAGLCGPGFSVWIVSVINETARSSREKPVRGGTVAVAAVTEGTESGIGEPAVVVPVLATAAEVFIGGQGDADFDTTPLANDGVPASAENLTLCF